VTAVALGLTSGAHYEATAKLLVGQTEPTNDLLLNAGSAQVVDPERNVETNAELIKLDTVANLVRERLKVPVSTKELLSKVSTEVTSTSNVVSVTAQDADARAAARIANSFATQYAFLRRRSDRASLEQATAAARDQLASLSPTERASAQGQQLSARMQDLRIAAASQTGGVEVVSRATAPSSLSRPPLAVIGIVAALLGLVLGVIVALAVDFADPRPKAEDG
jgi:uncharacterized protein involved in exopolysaccharide biosynthesis